MYKPFFLSKNEHIHKTLSSLTKPRVIIIRIKPLGDTILMTPVFRALKKAYSHSFISVVLSRRYTEAIEMNPDVDEILEYDEGSYFKFLTSLVYKKFDVSIDFINNPRSAQITLLANATFRLGKPGIKRFFYNVQRALPQEDFYNVHKSLGVLKPLGIHNPAIEYYFEPNHRAKVAAREFLKKIQIPIIGFYISGSAPVQKWPLKYFMELAMILTQRFDVKILLLWGPEDRAVIEELELSDYTCCEKVMIAPPTSISELGALMQQCKAIVTGDGGPKHMAVAMGIPTITIFGSIGHKSWNPPNDDRFPAVYSNIPCYPCFDKKSCRFDTYECLHSIEPHFILNEIEKLSLGLCERMAVG